MNLFLQDLARLSRGVENLTFWYFGYALVTIGMRWYFLIARRSKKFSQSCVEPV